jgi:uncharacterized RmlC-like cupin family protein
MMAETCTIIRANAAASYEGKQGLSYFEGISAQNSPAQAICMHLLHVPPGERSKAHKHADHETTIYVLSGKARMWYGERLEHIVDVQAGDFLYIPADVPHMHINSSDTEMLTAVIARTDPNEQFSVVLLPELEVLVDGAVRE